MSSTFPSSEFKTETYRCLYTEFRSSKELITSVSTYGYENNEKIPLYLSKTSYDRSVHLFLYNGHYCTINNFQRFIGGDHYDVCPRCFQGYRNKKSFINHIEMCAQVNENGSVVRMCKEGTYTELKRIPTIQVADFEATLEQRTQGPKGTINHHTANSFKLYVISDADLGDIPLQYSFRSTISDVEFVKLISSLSKDITERHNELKARYALPELSEDEEIEFSNAEHCIFCTKVLGTDRVRDHNHYTGKYNGAAHQKCNLLATETTTTIPCYFHNMNYDIKQFLPAFEKLKGEDYFKHASVIPCNI